MCLCRIDLSVHLFFFLYFFTHEKRETLEAQTIDARAEPAEDDGLTVKKTQLSMLQEQCLRDFKVHRV